MNNARNGGQGRCVFGLCALVPSYPSKQLHTTVQTSGVHPAYS